MTKYDLISRQLRWVCEEKIYPDRLCAFTGEVGDCVRLKDLFGKTFTTWGEAKFNSEYVSLPVYACTACIYADRDDQKKPIFISQKHFLCTENEFKFLQQAELMNVLLSPPRERFVFSITESHKKHTIFYTEINKNPDRFIIGTDAGSVLFNIDEINKYLPIIQNWYSIPVGSKNTYFTKTAIKTGEPSHKAVNKYGLKKYIEENEIIKRYRGSPLFSLVVYCLQPIQS